MNFNLLGRGPTQVACYNVQSLNMTHLQTHIDHLVIAAETLEQGVAYVKEQLGVGMPFGGVHPQMGTHNHLMRLGDGIFLEVIAINPDAEPPRRPRWFGLDDALIRAQLAVQPVLLTWVVNSNDIDQLIRNAAFSAGTAEPISRGDLHWHFGLPEDGRLLAGGTLPYAIEWHTDRHPAESMADLGCRFEKLEIYHPRAEWLQSALESIAAQDLVTVHPLPGNETAYMVVSVQTPAGLKSLSSKIC
ncbi:MAG: VOC family protein [Desulfuromonas sp.]|nr:MAG: VOC family protein [Desulfuromonas sp.]